MYIRPPIPAGAKWDEVIAWENNRFGLFLHDLNRYASEDEIELSDNWNVVMCFNSDIVELAIDELIQFTYQTMGVTLKKHTVNYLENNTQTELLAALTQIPAYSIVITLGGGDQDNDESFTLDIAPERVLVSGYSEQGAFSGIIHLINLMGIRSAPILPRLQERIFWPALSVRAGSTRYTPQNMTLAADLHNGLSPKMTPEEQAMELRRLGYNQMWVTSDELVYVAQSSVLKEIQDKNVEARLTYMKERVDAAHRYGMKAIVCISVWCTFPADHVIFKRHPGLRGATKLRTTEQGPLQKDDIAHHTLCTENPVAKKFIYESIQNIFNKTGMDNLLVLVGGEHFHHCFMRPLNQGKGHTDCPVCEALSAETVVSNLIKLLSDAVHSVKPDGEVIFWPYSASWAWSKEIDQETFIGMMEGSGAALLTELEKDVWIRKGGYVKHLWDYSFDHTACSNKARAQLEYCRRAGIRAYLKNEPKLPLEMINALYLPCIDRFADRYYAIAASGADGVFNIDAFVSRPHTLSQLLSYFMWIEPNPNREHIIMSIATMIAQNNKTAAYHIRSAWNYFSEAIGYIPYIPRYVHGPAWLGPAHPLLLYEDEIVSEKFYTIEATIESYSDSFRPREPIFEKDLQVLSWYTQWGEEPEDAQGTTQNKRLLMRDWNESARLCDLAIQEIENARKILGSARSTLFLVEWTTLKHLCLTVRTCRNVSQFYLNRNRVNELTANDEIDDNYSEMLILIEEMEAIARDELACAQSDEECLILNPWNDYRHQSDGPVCYRTLEILREKIKHTKLLLSKRLPEYKNNRLWTHCRNERY